MNSPSEIALQLMALYERDAPDRYDMSTIQHTLQLMYVANPHTLFSLHIKPATPQNDDK